MQILVGKNPYSSFRFEKLVEEIRNILPQITQVTVNELYLLPETLSEEALEKLNLIMGYPLVSGFQGSATHSQIFITPRFGTLSSWSSKATEILKLCGLSRITRIERGLVYQLTYGGALESQELSAILPLLHDKMTQTYGFNSHELQELFTKQSPSPAQPIPLLKQGIEALYELNRTQGFALSEKEMSFLYDSYRELGRDPTETELMMFAQINSEHCRHKIFNAKWSINGEVQEKSLFDMIRHTYACTTQGVLSAYKDNGAIVRGPIADEFQVDPKTNIYSHRQAPAHIVIKVETHNHPTAIAPFEGAATGSGGEIRDEGATGRGAKPKAGLTGFCVSNLHIPLLPQPWECDKAYPGNIATALDIMLQGPIGAASFNNEFGRPNICGYFRVFEMPVDDKNPLRDRRGYHKPIMLAGGLGQIREESLQKHPLPLGATLVILGGPALLIGLGGGAASSVFSGEREESLDFASVQRSNPEMQRRCQEVISTCVALGEINPIISIHDVGAGGLSNALPELVYESHRGALFDLSAIPTADSRLNAMEIWCNEAQERYVLAIDPQHLSLFSSIAHRERCPYAVVGTVNESGSIQVQNSLTNEMPVNLPLEVLFGEASKRQMEFRLEKKVLSSKINTRAFDLKTLIERVLQLPTVSDKSFLITIGDRTVTGLVARDQMVGPWQIPVSDVGVTATDYTNYSGEAMAMGERPTLALLNAPASARMAVGEAITNLIAADVRALEQIKLSANWMAAANVDEEASQLYAAVEAVAMSLCPALELCIPVGKDSLSMQMKWQKEGVQYNVTSPVSLVISAFSPVQDIRETLTPLLSKEGSSQLLLIELGHGKNRLGGSALAQVIGQLGEEVPDLEVPEDLIHFFHAIKMMRDESLLMAYHDRSDGGLITTLCEMSFASHLGITIDLTGLGDPIAALFSEELGAVIQYASHHQERVHEILAQVNLLNCAYQIGHINTEDKIVITQDNRVLFEDTRASLHQKWSSTSYHLKKMRDNPICAEQEYQFLLEAQDPGLSPKLTFDIPTTPPRIAGTRPKVAILREQGVNGHIEMAAAFDRAGFEAVDVHMTDILSGNLTLTSFQGLVACGGFSYGDVLGAGKGWANSILFNERAAEEFSNFFNLPSIFVLGVCNGCQMLSQLKGMIPGAGHWPYFGRNESEQFEARLSLVKVNDTPSIFLQGMADSFLPIAVSHGEGRAIFDCPNDITELVKNRLIPLQYIDNFGNVTQNYPANPNGSPQGIAAITNRDGRFTLMMPHAERVFRNVQLSWYPKEWGTKNSPWFQLFLNARKWLN